MGDLLQSKDLSLYELHPSVDDPGSTIRLKKLQFNPRNYGYYGSWLHGYKMSPPKHYPLKDLDVFYQENKRAIVQTIAREVTELGSVKVRLSFYVRFKKEVENVTEEMEHFFWNENPLIVTHMHQLRDSGLLDGIVNANKEEISRWQNQGSDWVIDRILTVYLEFARYEPIRGGTYVPTPSKLKAKKAIINVKNRDDQCLQWALRAALFPVQVHVDRPGSYPVNDGLDFTGIDFPTPLHQISQIDRLNNLAINVFGWRNNKTVIVRVSEVEDPNVRRINLMLLTGRNTTHYCYIRSLSRLLHSEYDAGGGFISVRDASKDFPQNEFSIATSFTAGESKAGRYEPKCQRTEKTPPFSRTTRTG